jgi:hypothetical protein
MVFGRSIVDEKLKSWLEIIMPFVLRNGGVFFKHVYFIAGRESKKQETKSKKNYYFIDKVFHVAVTVLAFEFITHSVLVLLLFPIHLS